MSFLHVCTLKTTDDWSSKVHLLDDIDQTLRNGVTSNYAAEDVDENCRNFWIAGDEIEGRSNSFGSRTSANVQEIRRGAAVELDDVHCGHCEASTIHKTANIAIQFDEIETMSRKSVNFTAGRLSHTRRP